MTDTTDTTAKPWNGWFSLAHCCGLESLKSLPVECVENCSGPGRKDEAVEHWVKELEFDGPSWLFRSHLREYGCWDAQQLADHQENRRRVLWLWACNCSEDEDGAYEWLYLGL